MLKNWDDMKILLALSRHRTMTAAAKALDINTGTISRRLERITAEVGATLFVRRGNDWEATGTAIPLIRAAEQFDESVSDRHKANPETTNGYRKLAISLDPRIMADLFVGRLAKFLSDNPDISLEIHETDMSVALGEVDLALSFREPSAGRLVRRLLGTVGYRFYVHSDWDRDACGYIELDTHDDHKDSQRSSYMGSMFGDPRLTTSSIADGVALMKEMPLAMCLPTRFAERQKDLKAWKPNAPVNYDPVWGVYHESRRLDPDIRLALDFATQCVT